MAKTKREEPAAQAGHVPSDLLWAPDREVTVFAVIPCRRGHRLVEMTTTIEEACAFGTVSDIDVGDVVLARAKRKLTKQAVEA